MVWLSLICLQPSKRVIEMKRCFFIWVVAGLVLFLTSSGAVAKKEPLVEKDDPPAETEIICFAAKEKWVCAPARERQQAHQKAMRLIETPDDNEVDDEPATQVQITTVPQSTQWDVTEESLADNEVNAPAQVEVAESDPTPATQATPTEKAITSDQSDTELSATASPSSLNFRDWQQQQPAAWVLQLVGTTNLPNLEQFINQHDLSDATFAIATTEVKGAPWHIVLLGVFDSREAALAHRDTLSQSLQSAWARPVAGIQLLD